MVNYAGLREHIRIEWNCNLRVYALFCFLNAIRTVRLDAALEKARRHLAYRALDAARPGWMTRTNTVYSAEGEWMVRTLKAHDALFADARKLIAKPRPLASVRRSVATILKRCDAADERLRRQMISSHLEVCVILCMLCIYRDWAPQSDGQYANDFTQCWYDGFYKGPDDPCRKNDWTVQTVRGMRMRLLDSEGFGIEVGTHGDEDSEKEGTLAFPTVLFPENEELSDEAIETIGHLCYYMSGRGGLVLFSDRTGVLVKAASAEDMIDAARECADEMLDCMPDFTPHDMNDDCGLLLMQGGVFGFRPYGLATAGFGAFSQVLEVREECVEACRRKRIVAVVWNDEDDYTAFMKT